MADGNRDRDREPVAEERRLSGPTSFCTPNIIFDVGVNISPWVLAELGKLDAALVPEPGLRVVEFRVDRRWHRELHTRLRESVAAALA